MPKTNSASLHPCSFCRHQVYQGPPSLCSLNHSNFFFLLGCWERSKIGAHLLTPALPLANWEDLESCVQNQAFAGLRCWMYLNILITGRKGPALRASESIDMWSQETSPHRQSREKLKPILLFFFFPFSGCSLCFLSPSGEISSGSGERENKQV